MTVYAIGDIHGQLDALNAAYDRIADDRAREGTGGASVVHVGDYVDRGPDVPGVLDRLIAARDAGEPFVFLAGNHDRMMLHYLDPDHPVDRLSASIDWLNSGIGGQVTLRGYGIDRFSFTSRAHTRRRARAAVPEAHVAFLRGLALSHSVGELFFVHAGVNPEVPLDGQSEEDLLWIRWRFLDWPDSFGPLVVHGHTPAPRIDHAGNRVNIDTGAGFGRPLSAVAIEGRDVYELTASGRRAVSPPESG